MTLRNIPPVEGLLQNAPELIRAYGRPLVTQALRETLQTIRADVQAGADVPSNQQILGGAASRLASWTRSTLEPVINATGVIIHTNLGRAPLSRAAIEAIQAVSAGYSSLEFDLKTGKRGSRLVHAEAVLQRLTGAEAAVVVNNNAAAVLLTLSALANRKRAIIARGQMIEIGGSFRIPDVMKQSGAKLVEVGSTNKVHLRDYEEALDQSVSVKPSLVIRAHRSNFRIVGFTEEPSLKDICETAHAHNALVIDDLGSGTFFNVEKYGLSHEPTILESLAAGADVVTFSGDKLLGGPQAGIIVGKKTLLDKIKKHPLARAVRADKTCLAGITATLLHYLKDEAETEIPIWRMIAQTPESLKARAESWKQETGPSTSLRMSVVPAESTIGGGSLPGENLPTYVLSLNIPKPDAFLAKLRQQNPAIIARTENDQVLLDPRTVLPEQDALVVEALRQLL
ncbi:MAG: L-seryl-tRNA(Sec) selenium transferase [Anaerolineales bacterium]|jgi:L-seryl-tRNA(Ser) seleniumtransferase|nr:L-seryl-tRNA(Sec) selenium transferase [Anaerolineales bacterium]